MCRTVVGILSFLLTNFAISDNRGHDDEKLAYLCFFSEDARSNLAANISLPFDLVKTSPSFIPGCIFFQALDPSMNGLSSYLYGFSFVALEGNGGGVLSSSWTGAVGELPSLLDEGLP